MSERKGLVGALKKVTRFQKHHNGVIEASPNGNWVRWESIKSLIDYFESMERK